MEHVARGVQQLQRIADLIRGLSPEKPWRVAVVPHRAKRTTEQNKLLWALYTEIARGTGATAEEVHEGLKLLFLPKRQITVGDQVLLVPGSTARLDTAEFSEYVERVQAWAASELGIAL